jgi:hypothetical protein
MVDKAEIKEHMEVVGSDGQHVGTVDHLDGDRLKLTRTDPTAGGEHHYIHIDMIQSASGGKITLSRTAAQARDEWGVKEVG